MDAGLKRELEAKVYAGERLTREDGIVAVNAASELLNNAEQGITALRSGVATNQATLTSTKTYHQTVINLAMVLQDAKFTA